MPLPAMLFADSMRRCAVALMLTALAWPCASAAASDDELGSFLNERGLAPAASEVSPPPQATPLPAGDERPAADRLSDLVVAAMGSLGVPYRRGGSSFAGGYDCSGFVQAMYEQNARISLPRQAAQQASATQTIDRDELQPGDLVFFNTLRRAYSHVGIYVGDFKFIHSPKPGAVVRIEDLRVRYWHSRFNGARRVQLNNGARTAALAQPSSSSAQYSASGYAPNW